MLESCGPRRSTRHTGKPGNDEGTGLHQLIELCGGFGPVWTDQILETTGHKMPVGTVAYGPESVDGVHEIFS